jgi:hypothetical protein
MLRSLHSQAESPNTSTFVELVRASGEDNLEWLQRARQHRRKPASAELLLVGGTGPVAFRLRVAQSHIRADITPSHWSHIALLSGTDDLFEISLEPPNGFGYPPPRNGLQKSPLTSYRSATQFPNIAWVELGVGATLVQEALNRFMRNRSAFDSLELLLAWLGFVWSVGTTGNPLISGMGIPAAAMVEAVTGAAGYELTPGLASRSSCPEAVWQTVRWWHSYYEKSKAEAPSGCWTASHFLVDDEYDFPPVDGRSPPPAAARGKRAGKATAKRARAKKS